MKTTKRFYIDKPGGSYGTKAEKRWTIFKRKPRVLRTTRCIDGNGVKYTEYVLEDTIPGYSTMTVGLDDPLMKKSRLTNTRVLKK